MAGIEHAIPPFAMTDGTGVKKEVRAIIGEFEVKHERTLRNYLGEWAINPDSGTIGGRLPTGTIEDFVLQHTVKNLTVDGKKVTFAAGNFWDQMPNLYDPETFESLPERLVKLSVEKNPRLGQHGRYAQVFGFYRPDEVEEKDPTPAGSSNLTPSTSYNEHAEVSMEAPPATITELPSVQS